MTASPLTPSRLPESFARALVRVVAVLALAGALVASAAPPAGFVRVRGTGFELDGQPYRFAGVNIWYAAYLGASGPTGDRARLERELAQLRDLGVTNLRILGASEPTPHAPLTPVFHPEPGQTNEELLRGLDYALDAIGRHGMKAVVFLNNQWEWSGGMSTYVLWATGRARPRADIWPDTLIYDTTFYSLPQARAWYLDYVRTLLTRTNTVNQRRYAEDPTIMSWQLGNEPRLNPDGQPTRRAEMLAWAREATQLIRELAPHHLISTGSEGVIGMNDSEEVYGELHALGTIDYLTVHIWPFNWKWFDPARGAETLPTVKANTRAYLARHVTVARQLGKPLVLEEFGLQRDDAKYPPGTPVTLRDAYFRDVFAAVLAERRAGSPLVGINLWAWSGEGVPADPQGAFWRPGTPLLGDNGIEKQGLNSIYSTDASTLELLRDLNRQLQEP